MKSVVDRKERRMFVRYPCDLEGDFLFSGGTSGKGRLKNISATGTNFVTTQFLPKEDAIMLKVTTKREHPLNLSGKICWLRQEAGAWSAGIAFDKPLFVPLKMFL